MVMTIKVMEDDYLTKPVNMIKYTLVGLTVMFMRHNGFVAIIGTGGLVFLNALFTKKFSRLWRTLIIGACLVGLFVGIKEITKVIINNAFTIEEERVVAAEVTDRSDFYEQEGYTDVTLMPNYVPTIIAVQQLIYTQHYCGDEFTAEQSAEFEEYVYIDKLDQHKEDYSSVQNTAVTGVLS